MRQKGKDCSILLYGKDGGIRQELKVPKLQRSDPVSLCRGGLRQSLRYNYKISGTVVTDPHKTHQALERALGATQNEFGSAAVIRMTLFRGDGCTSGDPRHGMFLYKLNIRGFSMDAGIPAKEQGTFAAVRDKIPYLKERTWCHDGGVHAGV